MEIKDKRLTLILVLVLVLVVVAIRHGSNHCKVTGLHDVRNSIVEQMPIHEWVAVLTSNPSRLHAVWIGG